MTEIQKEPTIILASGRIRCRRCQALSKRSREQCRKPALKSKNVCQIHGGRSTGAKTQEGRQRIADTRTTHGEQTRAKRRERSESSAYLRELEDVGRVVGLITGTRTRGRKPKNFEPIQTLQEAKAWTAADALGLHRKVKF